MVVKRVESFKTRISAQRFFVVLWLKILLSHTFGVRSNIFRGFEEAFCGEKLWENEQGVLQKDFEITFSNNVFFLLNKSDLCRHPMEPTANITTYCTTYGSNNLQLRNSQPHNQEHQHNPEHQHNVQHTARAETIWRYCLVDTILKSKICWLTESVESQKLITAQQDVVWSQWLNWVKLSCGKTHMLKWLKF